MPERSGPPAYGSDLERVVGRCPACGSNSLFVGSGGYLTCSVLGCCEPDAASTLLERGGKPVLSDDERAVMDHIGAAMQGILDLGLTDTSTNLRVELAAAVHVLQTFVVQHMLQRVAPGDWGQWFKEAPHGR